MLSDFALEREKYNWQLSRSTLVRRDARQRGHVLSRVGWTSQRRDTREERLRYSRQPMYFPFWELIAPSRTSHAIGVRYIGFCKPQGRTRAFKDLRARFFVEIAIPAGPMSPRTGFELHRCSVEQCKPHNFDDAASSMRLELSFTGSG